MLVAAMETTMFTGCGGKETTESTGADASGTEQQSQSGSGSDSGDKITLKLFSNLPDRKNGQGLIEQTIIDEYMEENQNVDIKVEAPDGNEITA